MESVLLLSLSDGMDLIDSAKNLYIDEQIYIRWITGGYDQHYSFDDFKKELGYGTRAGTETEKKILDKVKGILS